VLVYLAAAGLFPAAAHAVGGPPDHDSARELPTPMKGAVDGDEGIPELERLSDAFSRIAEQVKPSVVHIRARSFDKDLNRMIREFSGEDDHVPVPTTGTGSGIILDADGHILTNNHVVANAAVIWVTLADGRKFKAQVVGTDPMTDLAVIRIRGQDLRPARLGDSDGVRVGHLVLAIGSPFRLGHSVSHGMISGIGRSGDNIDVDIDYKNWIQTDAPINPGNSGGPLINTRGEVIGINVAIATESGGHQGVGFAIPSNIVRRIAAVLKRGEKVARGYLGVSIQPVDEDVASAYELPEPGGVLIREVGEDSPAARSKLRSDDIVTAINGRRIRTLDELQEAIASTPPGSKVEMTVWRRGAQRNLLVTVGPQPEGFSTRATRLNFQQPGPRPPRDSDQAENPPAFPTLSGPFARYGFEARTLSRELARKYRIDEEFSAGVVVTRVDPTSDAFEAGLRPTQLIVQVNDEPLRDARQLEKLCTPEALGKGLRLRLRAGDKEFQTILRVKA